MPRASTEWQRYANRVNSRLREFSKAGVEGETEQLVRELLRNFYEKNPDIRGVGNIRPDSQVTMTASTSLTRNQQNELRQIGDILLNAKSGTVSYYTEGGVEHNMIASYQTYLQNHPGTSLQEWIDKVDNYNRMQTAIGYDFWQHIGTDEAENIDKMRSKKGISDADLAKMMDKIMRYGKSRGWSQVADTDKFTAIMKEMIKNYKSGSKVLVKDVRNTAVRTGIHYKKRGRRK